MHTPDGFLTSWICVSMLLLSAAPLILSLRNLSRAMDSQKALAIGTVSAIIFIAQMLNFPIAGGTSGHLIGAVFALALLGVDAAVVSMALVLIVQALVFGDGGVLSLGANIFNMGVLGVYSADFIMKRMEIGQNLKLFAAGLMSVVAASLACSLELAASGTSELFSVLTSMISTHAVIGAGEGLITIALVGIFASRMESATARSATALAGLSFLALSLLLPFASGSPDGLERVAIDIGFFGNAAAIYEAPMPDYAFAFFETAPYLASLTAALIGCAMVFSIPQIAFMAIPSPRA